MGNQLRVSGFGPLPPSEPGRLLALPAAKPAEDNVAGMSAAPGAADSSGGVVLGIETSCDDTACAVLDGSGRVLSSVVSSQLQVHQPFGGVVPEAASREHLRNWPAVSAAAFAEAGIDWSDVGAVAATRGPGLVGSLLVGLSLGKAISYSLGVPFLAVHHLEGHLYSPLLRDDRPSRPVPNAMVGLVVSGGHTSLLEVDGTTGAVTSLAETRDDAIGGAFDKIGHRIGLPFPGGAAVDRLAELGNAAERPLRARRLPTDRPDDRRTGPDPEHGPAMPRTPRLSRAARPVQRGRPFRFRVRRQPLPGGAGRICRLGLFRLPLPRGRP